MAYYDMQPNGPEPRQEKVQPAKRLTVNRKKMAQVAHQPRTPKKITAPPRGQLLRRLEQLEDELKHDTTQTGAMRWMIPYADLLTLLLGLFLAMMAYSIQDKAFLESSAQKLTDNLHQQEAMVAQQDADLQAMKKSLNTLVASVAEQATEKKALLDKMKAAAGTTDPSTSAPLKTENPLAQKLADVPSMTVHQEQRGLVITLLDSVLFESGRAQLSPESKKTLGQLADILKVIPNSIQIEGHTDNTPIKTAEYPSNWYLSTARATKIIEYWVTQHGFNPTRLSASGYGPYRPVSPNSSPRGKQENRRVDIIVLNPSADLGGLEPVAEHSADGENLHQTN